MADTPRYAIYYVPAPDSGLNGFGAELLGYDAFSGEDLPFPADILQEAPDWVELTNDPRKYGFHATLKAPMALADGKTEAELLAACATFAATPRTIPEIRPVIGLIEGFIAVIPAEPSPDLIRLAARCVREFDSFRAPLSEADRLRRNPSRLTATQRANLDRWGYPHVMDDFRFHMTLTGRLDAERREPLLKMLAGRFAMLRLGTLPIDRIAIFRQENAASPFRVVNHWKLRAPQA